MEVHAPHSPVRSIKDFMVHLLAITIGLLIAPGLWLEGAIVEIRVALCDKACDFVLRFLHRVGSNRCACPGGSGWCLVDQAFAAGLSEVGTAGADHGRCENSTRNSAGRKYRILGGCEWSSSVEARGTGERPAVGVRVQRL